ncbi:MAG: aldo/keto reductase [Christensenellaceae bacterium]|jgi:predicted aldo/keto reductase-like oxidoreductase
MTTRTLGNIKEKISLLGFGCMRFPKVAEDKQDIDEIAAQEMIDYAMAAGVNYYDTAYPYHEGMSETFVGKALKKYDRESFYLATKMPIWLLENEADCERYFNEQLEKCQVEYFDFYLLHNMNTGSIPNVEKSAAYDFVMQKKKEGKIRYVGFSFHDHPDVLQKIVDQYAWDFAQIQLNYLDWELQDAKRQYEILTAKNIPVIVMEPVRGGTLATLSEAAEKILKDENATASLASWAMRYAGGLPNVLTVLSGMSDLAQVKDNVSVMSSFTPLSAQEEGVLQEAAAAYRASGTIPCTGCRYCMDCPVGIDIPKVLAAYNQYQIGKNPFQFKNIYESALTEEQKAHNCISCGVCVPKCPQFIDIPAWMEKVAALAVELKEA